MILRHESFEDILAIVNCHKHQGYQSQLTIAVRVLEHLSSIFSRELSHNLEAIESLSRRATLNYLRQSNGGREARVLILKGYIAGISAHKEALSSIIVFRAAEFKPKDENWKWEIGNEIPRLPKKSELGSELSQLPDVPPVCTLLPPSGTDCLQVWTGIYLPNKR